MVLCREHNCSAKFHKHLDFRAHLINEHNLEHGEISFDFLSEEEFNLWLFEYEEHNFVKFVKRSSYCSKSNVETRYLRCNRDGHQTSVSKKLSKETGSRKLNDNCTAGWLTIVITDGKYHVTLYPTHYNHDIDISHKQHLPLPQSVKNDIIKRIRNDVPLPVILLDLKEDLDTIPDEQTKVFHYSSYDNLYYMKTLFAHQFFKKDKDDTVSVQKWISDNPEGIIYHKFQGSLDPNYPVSFFLFNMFFLF